MYKNHIYRIKNVDVSGMYIHIQMPFFGMNYCAWKLTLMHDAIYRVDLELPTVQVRFQNLSVEAECKVVHGKPLPTLWNTIKNIFSVSVVLIFNKRDNSINQEC